VQNLSISECEALVEEALRLKSSAEILECCRALAQSHYADLLG
jgi:hypothetical protein